MRSKVEFCTKTKEEVYREVYIHSHGGIYVSYLRGKRCTTEDAFFHEVSASLQFPSYFGENWAAFDECMCDLEWICFNSLLIIVDDFDSMFAGNKETQMLLIEYFEDMIAYWDEMSVSVKVWLNVATTADWVG